MYADQALYKEPHGGYTPWHCDAAYWPLASDKAVTAWIPLQVCQPSLRLYTPCYSKLLYHQTHKHVRHNRPAIELIPASYRLTNACQLDCNVRGCTKLCKVCLTNMPPSISRSHLRWCGSSDEHTVACFLTSQTKGNVPWLHEGSVLSELQCVQGDTCIVTDISATLPCGAGNPSGDGPNAVCCWQSEA